MAIRLPTLRGLQAFEAIARSGSVVVAARDLGLSPGAISQHLARLEDEIGLALFERRGRSLRLTSWGAIYMENVRAGFDHLRAGDAILQRARLDAGIVISAPPSISICWLRSMLIEWRELNRTINIRLIGEDDEPLFEQNTVDFRITYGAARHKYSHFTDLFVDKVVPMCSPSFLLSNPVRSAADLFEAPLIGIEWQNPYQSPPSWADWAIRFGVDPDRGSAGLSFSLSSSAIDAAASGAGFVLGQASLAWDCLAEGRLVIACDCAMELSEPYALAWNPSTLDRPCGKAFKSYLTQAIRHRQHHLLSCLVPA